MKTVSTKEQEEFTKLGVYQIEIEHEPESSKEATFTYKDQKGVEHEVKVLTTDKNYSIMFDRVEGKSQMYEGEFKHNEKEEAKYQRHGKGRLIVLDNDQRVVVEGEWKNNVFSGEGTITLQNGQYSEGTFKNGMLFTGIVYGDVDPESEAKERETLVEREEFKDKLIQDDVSKNLLSYPVPALEVAAKEYREKNVKKTAPTGPDNTKKEEPKKN